MNTCEYSSSLNNSSFFVQCVRKDSRCGYHKKGHRLRFLEWMPKNLCPEAYHNLYYFTLGILFGVKFEDNKVAIKCPSSENYVVFSAYGGKLNYRFKLLNLIKRILSKLYYGQCYKSSLFWRIIEIKGVCPYGHLLGQRFQINKGNFQLTQDLIFPLGEPKELCPGIFDNLFPYLQILQSEGRFPFSDVSSDFIQCPDHKANITFRVDKKNAT